MMFSRRISTAVALCSLWLLAGCAGLQQPDYKNLPDRSTLHAGEDVTVAPNENVYSIARKYNVSMREIIVLNDLKPPFTVKAGQSLTLPLRESDLPKAPAAAPRTSIEAVPLEPINKPVSSAPLSAAPAPAASTSVATSAPTSLATPVESSALSAPAPAAPRQLETTVTARKQVASAATVKEVPSAAPVETASAASSGTSSFSAIPPVQGTIISAFGSKGQGQSNDGINIGAPKGASVVAASGGIVVYAGNEMKGFGNLILIRHEGGWVTAYAHLDRMLVSKDTVVAPGDQIGTVGTSGGVTVPQLHFEARQDGKPVDPQTILKQI